MFMVNQKIVCVNNRLLDKRVASLVVGRIYTIRFIKSSVKTPSRGVGLLLDEIINDPNQNGLEYGYYSDRFRPIVERKTSIEIFTDMLVPSRQKETAQ